MKKLVIFLAMSSIIYTQADILSFFNAIKTGNNNYALSFVENKKYKDKNDYTVVIENDKELIDINKKDENGYTAILIATMYNNLELFKKFVEMGANMDVDNPILNSTILNTAIYYNSTDVAMYIIKNYPQYINKGSDIDGWLPIQDAVLRENEKILISLLNNGAEIRKKDKLGNDAMDLATIHGKGKMVKILRDFELNKK